MRSGRYNFDSTGREALTIPLQLQSAGVCAFLLGLPAASSLIARNADFAEQSTVWAATFRTTARAA